MIKLRLPVKQIDINQPFGVNYLNFYKNMGLLGHNGIDFRAKDGFNCYASHDGIVTWAGEDSGGGISINLTSNLKGPGFYTIYYHLKDIKGSDGKEVKVGDKIIAGEIIGHCDNTGQYTTGDHLHFGLKETFDGGTINKDNGYAGAINPAPYFAYAYDGFVLEDKWDACNALQRYYRKDKRNLLEEIKVAIALRKYLGRLPSNEQIKACVYGSWDREAVANPAMRDLWAFETKGDFINHKLLFTD